MAPGLICSFIVILEETYRFHFNVLKRYKHIQIKAYKQKQNVAICKCNKLFNGVKYLFLVYRQLESRCTGTNNFWPKMYKIFIPWSIHSMTVQPFCPLYLVYQVPKDNLLEGWVPVYLSDVCFISPLNILDRATTVSSEAGTWQFCQKKWKRPV